MNETLMTTTKMQKNGTVFSYARWSSAQQSLGDSERRQLQASEDFAQKNGFSLSPETFEDKGVSAWHGAHRKSGKLGALLERVQPGDAIAIESYSRWSREHPLDGLNALRETTDRGVIVHFTTYGMSISRENFKSLFPMLSLHAQLANSENEERSFKIKEAMKTRKAQLLSGKAVQGRLPCWLRWEEPKGRPDLGKPVVIEEKARVVREIFDLCLNGKGVLSIETLFRKRPTISNSKKAVWNSRFIHRLLTDKSVLGFHNSTGKRVYPTIIEEGKFYAAGSMLKDRREPTVAIAHKNNNLFTGLLKCSKCGLSIVRQQTHSGENKYDYLCCKGALRHLSDCKFRTIRYDKLEESFLFLIRQADLIRLIMGGEQKPSIIHELKGKLADAEKRSEKILRMIDGDPSPSRRLAEQLKLIEAEESDLQQQIESETAKEKVKPAASAAYDALLGEFATHIHDDKRGQFREGLQSIVERIVVDPEKQQYEVRLRDAAQPVTVLLRKGGFLLSPAPYHVGNKLPPLGATNVIG